MLLALREVLRSAEGAGVDLDALALRLDADRDAVRAAIEHGIARGWLEGVELASLPAGCGSVSCAPVASSPACKRCPLAP